MSRIASRPLMILLPAITALHCAPEVTIEPKPDMRSPDVTPQMPRTAKLKFTGCTAFMGSSMAFTATISNGELLKLDGTKFKENCNTHMPPQSELYQFNCTIEDNGDIAQILKGSNPYLRIRETYWLPALLIPATNNMIAVQGQMDLGTQAAPYEVGGTRSALFAIETDSFSTTSESKRTINLPLTGGSLSNITQVAFRLPSLCKNSLSDPPLKQAPFWQIEGIEVSNSPDFSKP